LDWSTQNYAVAYDLTIEGLHTYFVSTGNTDVLVHNCGNAPNGPTLDFAHGTSATSATSIVDGGLSEAAARSLNHGGSMNRPGSFHTFAVSPSDTRGLQDAYLMGGRGIDDCIVLVCSIPQSTYDDLVATGDVIVQPLPGAPIPQTVFGPGAFDRINEVATWQQIKPGG